MMDLKGIKITILFFLVIAFFSCKNKSRKLIYLIPENYAGEVNVFWNKERSKKHYIKYKDDFYIIVISGNPEKMELNEEPIPEGPYELEYYYFSKDTIYQINSTPHKDYLPQYPNAGSGYVGYLGNEIFSSFFVNKDSLSSTQKNTLHP